MVNYYVCATPYHIINSILIRNNYYDADYNIMLLTENCRNADQLLGLMEQENIFDECIYIDDSILKKTEASFVKHYKKLLKRFLDASLIDEFLKIKTAADRIIVFSFTMFNTLVQSRFAEMKNDVEICVGEDGIRDYIYKDFGISEPIWFKIIKLIRKCSGHPLITLPSNDKRFLYKPQLREILYGDNKAINIIKSSDIRSNIGIINRIFRFSPEADIKEKYIYFDSIYDVGLMKLQKQIISELNRRCDDFILKQHPRNLDRYEGVRVYKYSYIPWEVICMNCDLNEKVLITVNSNACFSPKFMLDCEPKVIFLYKLFFKGRQLADTEKLIRLLKESYVDKKKIIIPGSFDELKVILEECKR